MVTPPFVPAATLRTCPRVLEDGAVCGGLLSTPIRGRHTGRWFQTCPRCGETRSTETAPSEITDRPLTGRPTVAGLPLTWQQRLEDEQP